MPTLRVSIDAQLLTQRMGSIGLYPSFDANFVADM